MGYIETYEKYSKAIIEEHEKVFGMLDMGQLKEFLDAVIAAKRIFLHGTGREGISMRSFAMRLAHLGKPAYWLMDDTTVGMKETSLSSRTEEEMWESTAGLWNRRQRPGQRLRC